MFGPDWDEGCPSCSSVADGFDEMYVHLRNHDVAFTAVSRAPLAKLLAYRERMGWTFPWASSAGSDFNFDFGVSFTEESVAQGQTYNFRALEGWQVDPANLPVRGTRHERVRASRTAWCTTRTPRTRAASTRCGTCGSGSTARRSAATRTTCRGSAATTRYGVERPVTLAHVGGVPVEEWLTPLLAMGGGLAVALRASIRRSRREP